MILNIIPPASMLADLGAEPGDRILVGHDGRWAIYTAATDHLGDEVFSAKRDLTASEVEALRVTAEDIAEAAGCGRRCEIDDECDEGEAKALDWLRYGITRPDFLRWTSRGLYEPAIVADLIAAGVDPDSQRHLLGCFAEALNDGDISVAEFVTLCRGAQ